MHETSNENKMKARKRDASHTPADFETAMDAVGFGWYNILLLLVALLAAMASVFETSTVSYILQSAECDLGLTLLNKGVLNAITYAGMMTSAVFWGFLADTRGRKKILCYGLLADGVCVLGSAMSQDVLTLMILKYLGGFIINGPFAVLVTYLTELHNRQYRARVIMIVGIMFSISSLVLPALALAVLPTLWNFHLYGLTFHVWQIFLAICAIPSLVSGALLMFYPESPKFLMSQGRNAEALGIFRTMYALNHHRRRDSYPIKELVHELPEQYKTNKAKDNDNVATISVATIESTDKVNYLETEPEKHKVMSWGDGLRQLAPLFRKPYLSLSLRVYLLNCFLLLGQNTMRLWLPQLFGSIAEYEEKFHGASSLCDILAYSANKTTTVECEVVISAEAYTNNIIVALTGFFGYILASFVVNVVGGKWIMTFSMIVSGTAGIALYWAASALATLITSTFFVTMGSIASTSLIGASAQLFPTSLRTMVVSLTMMVGRSGSLIGNILFPLLVSTGCVAPFIMLSLAMFLGSGLAAFLPNTKKMALK